MIEGAAEAGGHHRDPVIVVGDVVGTGAAATLWCTVPREPRFTRDASVTIKGIRLQSSVPAGLDP